MDDPNRSSSAIPKPPPLAESLPEERLIQTVPLPSAARARTLPISQPVVDPELESHLRQANLLRVRGDVVGAIREIENAGVGLKSSSTALETLGDLLLTVGKTDEALTRYREAAEINPSPTIESKIARILLKQQGGSGYSEESDALYKVRGPITIAASAIVPGLGLAMGGKIQSAAVAFCGWIISYMLMFVLPPSRQAIEAFSGHSVASSFGTALLFILGLVNLGFWVYSMIETTRLAKSAEKDG